MKIYPAKAIPVHDCLIIDASHHLWRVLWGRYRGGVNGIVPLACKSFLSAIQRDLYTIRAKAIFVCWESHEVKNWKIGVQGYKVREGAAEEGPTVEHYAQCANILKKTLQRIGIHQAYSVGHEADETIAKLVHSTSRDESIVIISADHDFHQLMSLANVKQVTYKAEEPVHISSDEVYLEYGIAPSLLPYAFALAGDSSDKLKGVPGIGILTATKIIAVLGPFSNWLLKPDFMTIKPDLLSERHWEAIKSDGAERIVERYKLVDLLTESVLPKVKIIYPDIEECGVPTELWETVLNKELS